MLNVVDLILFYFSHIYNDKKIIYKIKYKILPHQVFV